MPHSLPDPDRRPEPEPVRAVVIGRAMPRKMLREVRGAFTAGAKRLATVLAETRGLRRPN